MSACLSRTLQALLLALMLANLTGVLFSDGFVPLKLADKRAPSVFLDAENEKAASAPDEPQLSEPDTAPEIVPIQATADHRPLLVTRLPKATGPPTV